MSIQSLNCLLCVREDLAVHSTSVAKTAYGEAGEPLQCALSQVQPVQLRRVQQSAEHADWRELVGRYHYLGHKTPYGASIRYLIESTSAQASLANERPR
jgi:glucan biosynthesis protein